MREEEIAVEDAEIVELYWRRDDRAIEATSERYGGYCAAIACSIVASAEDVEECLNDTYLQAWNSIPPHRPDGLRAFLGRITRNLALDRWREQHALKRGGGETVLVLDELRECVPDRADPAQVQENRDLAAALETFLRGLAPRERAVFLRRYWYCEPVGQVARRFGLKENTCKTILARTRARLKSYLIQEGIEL